MRIHKSITAKRILAAVRRQHSTLDNPGFCLACGNDADGCEPDMRMGTCECCGERAVYGAEELMFRTGAAGF